MNENDSKGFLGKGLKFPIQVDQKTGRFVMSEYEEDIREAIRIILRTSVGERVMRPDFGSKLNEYVFERNDKTLFMAMQRDIAEAIVIWEPRVQNVKVELVMDREQKNTAIANISYVVRTTNNMFNLVYPFYLLEGVES